MLIFFVVALLMVFAALTFIFVPLLRDSARMATASDGGSNVAVFKSQSRELDEELARGAISAIEHEAALSELSARVVDEVPEPESPPPLVDATDSRPWWLVVLVAIFLPLTAIVLYSQLGSPRGIELSAIAPGGPAAQAATGDRKPGEEPPMSDKQILAMVDSLSQKMQQNPGDPRGWILLARSQNALGRFVEAAASFEKAVALMPDDAQLLADYADAAVMTQQGRFEGKPHALIKQALKLEPTNMKALALAGTAELRMGNRAASLLHWEKLKTLVAKDSDDYREVESIIAEVKTTKLDAAAPTTAPPVPAVVPPERPNTGTAAKTDARISGKVVIAQEVIGKLAPGDTLFVFARAHEGPRMPLAVMRVPAPKASGFPLPFELTDAMAMAPGMNLSKFSEVVVEARISKSGNAQLQPGDLSGVTDVLKPGASGVLVTIGKVAP